jgi:hypothetical protein
MPRALSRLVDTPTKGQRPKKRIKRTLLAKIAVTIMSR